MSDAKRRALDGLASAVPDALAVITEALKKRNVERNQQHLHTLARYVLDAVLERLPEADSDAKPAVVQQMTPDAAVRELRKRLSGGHER